MARLCFGIYANVLIAYATRSTTKLHLVSTLLRSVDATCKLTSNAVSGLLRCTVGLPTGRSNSLGDIPSGVEKANPRAVSEYFLKKVVPLIEWNKRKAVLFAIREIIRQDDTIDHDTVVDVVSGTTKDDLLSRHSFVLADFLAGVFLYTVSVNNRLGAGTAMEIAESHVLSFAEESRASRIVLREQADPLSESSDAVFDGYLKKAVEKYGSVKTLLYKDAPRPLYDFYMPNHLECKARQGKGTAYTLENVTADTLMNVSKFLIITGTGGLGKSMMMRHLLLTTAQAFDRLRLVPVLVPLKDYGLYAGALADFIFSKVSDLNRSIPPEAFTQALSRGSLLLLLDGLDEMDASSLSRFEQEMETFTDKYPANQFVIASRAFQSFLAFGRFTTVTLCPLTKSQALRLVDRLDFRPDQLEIKAGFRNALDKTLYTTHRGFSQNPLLLTIMLLTFERFAEIPSKTHLFYREAFLALSLTHDASKGAFKRALKTGLPMDAFADRFAEICFRAYRDEKYELTDTEFAEYLRKSPGGDNTATADDFLYDLCTNLCLMHIENGRYHFLHRSFLEYFAALFMSKQRDEIIGRLGDFFEKRSLFVVRNNAFSMLYDMIPDKVEALILIPFLSGLLAECDRKEGYWTFLETMYPLITYEHGDTPDFSTNFPQSFLLRFIARMVDAEYLHDIDELPFEESLVVERYARDGKAVSEYCGSYEKAAIVGWQLEFDVAGVRKKGERYAELLDSLADDGFILKRAYAATRVLLENLSAKHRTRRNDLLDLL